MDNNFRKRSLAILYISRIVFILALLFIIVGTIAGIRTFGLLGIFLAAVSWITPGVFLIVRLPWLAQSWLRGINSIWIPATSWEEMSSGKKFIVYFYSILFSVFMVVALIIFAIDWFQK